ncbi:uncharacterized protein PFLUO_LOCUS2980 [Penicillium psychrofluorescens]|uniref:uncharacterized protein n=1 Tax=Penicillium psychrofluorescens TaxID=3158075 RepID=UPI003CCD5DBC
MAKRMAARELSLDSNQQLQETDSDDSEVSDANDSSAKITSGIRKLVDKFGLNRDERGKEPIYV